MNSRLRASVLPFVAWMSAVHASSDHTVFNPTPRDRLRDLSTDRPDQTESPYTVDAGHWQIEFDFVSYTHDRESGVRSESWNIAPINVKLGLTHSTDVQFIFNSYTRERVRARGTTTTSGDWGDFTVRLKHNLWGNDGGDSAFAVMPFVKVPLRLGDDRDSSVEAGLILPLALSLPGGWGLGLMTEFDMLADSRGGGRHLEWINSVALGRDLTSRLGGYIEFFSAHRYETGTDWMAQAGAGFTYAINADTQLDGGCNFGLTRGAPDVQPFLGLTVRY